MKAPLSASEAAWMLDAQDRLLLGSAWVGRSIDKCEEKWAPGSIEADFVICNVCQ